MNFDVDIVVASNAPKDLGPDVRVQVGLPTKDPWSLPFAHKAIFGREDRWRYDLFIYFRGMILPHCEDNIRAFLRVTPHLAPNEIAGFLPYDMDQAGNRSFSGVHKCFRWRPESVRQRGKNRRGAEFTNEHSCFYL